jgi:hypothetical protein
MVDQASLTGESQDGELPFTERRRPERAEFHNRELIGLLRGVDNDKFDFATRIDKSHNDLGTFLGILTSACLSLLLWGLIAVSVLLI